MATSFSAAEQMHGRVAGPPSSGTSGAMRGRPSLAARASREAMWRTVCPGSDVPTTRLNNRGLMGSRGCVLSHAVQFDYGTGSGWPSQPHVGETHENRY